MVLIFFSIFLKMSTYPFTVTARVAMEESFYFSVDKKTYSPLVKLAAAKNIKDAKQYKVIWIERNKRDLYVFAVL